MEMSKRHWTHTIKQYAPCCTDAISLPSKWPDQHRLCFGACPLHALGGEFVYNHGSLQFVVPCAYSPKFPPMVEPCVFEGINLNESIQSCKKTRRWQHQQCEDE